MARDAFRSAFGRVPGVLRRTVLPAIPDDGNGNALEGYRDLVDQVEALLKGLRQAGVPALSALPELLRFRSQKSNQVARVIRRGFAKQEEWAVRDAAESVFRWVLGYDEGYLPAPPATLVAELGDLLLTPRASALEPTLIWTNRLLKHAPNQVDASARQRLCDALELLLDETALPSIDVRLGAQTEEAELLLLRRPDIRALAAELSLRLEPLVEEDALEENSCLQTVAKWEKAMREDVFPKVRAVAERVGA